MRLVFGVLMMTVMIALPLFYLRDPGGANKSFISGLAKAGVYNISEDEIDRIFGPGLAGGRATPTASAKFVTVKKRKDK